MTDTTTPDMREDRLEVYRDGELIHERTIFVPALSPGHPSVLRARIAELEAELVTVTDAAIVALDPASTARAEQDALARLRALRGRRVAP
jgi:hypothetical protein